VNPTPFAATTAQLDDGVRIVSVQGELDLSTAPELETQLEEIVSSGDASLLIDLSSCEFIDSTGIALIVRAWQRLDRTADGEGNGKVVISSDNEQVRRVLDITGLELSIPIHSTREQGLEALRG
jgi:anti-anti-sigma factor